MEYGKQISDALMDLCVNFNEIERKVRHYGTDVEIHHAEIHAISTIKKYKGIHVTGLAELLGLTKGTVSEIIRKLERKGLIVKTPDEHNLSKLNILLTPKGETAHKNHLRYHAQFQKIFDRMLKAWTDDEAALISRFLGVLASPETKTEFDTIN